MQPEHDNEEMTMLTKQLAEFSPTVHTCNVLLAFGSKIILQLRDENFIHPHTREVRALIEGALKSIDPAVQYNTGDGNHRRLFVRVKQAISAAFNLLVV